MLAQFLKREADTDVYGGFVAGIEQVSQPSKGFGHAIPSDSTDDKSQRDVSDEVAVQLHLLLVTKNQSPKLLPGEAPLAIGCYGMSY
jgi:hypothetical protein